jgi:hypothetical protein
MVAAYVEPFLTGTPTVTWVVFHRGVSGIPLRGSRGSARLSANGWRSGELLYAESLEERKIKDLGHGIAAAELDCMLAPGRECTSQ